MNLIQPILGHAKTRPHAPALVDGDREIRYGELAGLVLRTASHLAALGVAPGDRIGLCLKDSWEHVVALLAVARMGAVIVPLNWRAARAEISGLVAALSIKLALVERESAPALDCTVVPVDARWHRSVAEREPLSTLPDDWQAPLMIAPTSGSTGVPKFSLASHLQEYCGAAGFTELMALSGRHRYLSTLPLYFSGGRTAVLLHLLRGDCVLLYGSLVNGPDFIEAAAKLRATVAVVVPSLVRDLLAIAGGEPLLPGFARLVCGGAPLFTEEKRAALRKVSPNFCQGYGTTETNGISILRSEDIESHAESVGQPHSLVEIQVVDEDDRPLAVGEAGKLRFRGPALASPLAAPGHPIHPGFRDGWFYPGEIGALDDQGYIYLTGRASELIIRHGAKIHPAEVEAVLQQHPDVLECAVIGRHAANNEEEVIAFLVGRRPLELAAIVAHCRTHLTAAKRPQRIHFVESLPKNPSGKIDKMALAKQLTDSS
jgi:acyl-CoA synthetase (AMP-forming)/AMP-acid ligase II